MTHTPAPEPPDPPPPRAPAPEEREDPLNKPHPHPLTQRVLAGALPGAAPPALVYLTRLYAADPG